MVCNLTAGREKFAEFEPEVVQIRAVAERMRGRLTEAVQADADAYGAVMDALALPRGSDREKARRADARQRALHDAARVPIEIAEACVVVIRLCDRAAGTTNPNLASDITVAALLAGGALESAIANVQINLPLLKDEAFTAQLRARVGAARAVRDALLDHVVERTRA
jgi:formiminotetrahydrofolate cyclodeaminase